MVPNLIPQGLPAGPHQYPQGPAQAVQPDPYAEPEAAPPVVAEPEAVNPDLTDAPYFPVIQDKIWKYIWGIRKQDDKKKDQSEILKAFNKIIRGIGHKIKATKMQDTLYLEIKTPEVLLLLCVLLFVDICHDATPKRVVEMCGQGWDQWTVRPKGKLKADGTLTTPARQPAPGKNGWELFKLYMEKMTYYDDNAKDIMRRYINEIDDFNIQHTFNHVYLMRQYVRAICLMIRITGTNGRVDSEKDVFCYVNEFCQTLAQKELIPTDIKKDNAISPNQNMVFDQSGSILLHTMGQYNLKPTLSIVTAADMGLGQLNNMTLSDPMGYLFKLLRYLWVQIGDDLVPGPTFWGLYSGGKMEYTEQNFPITEANWRLVRTQILKEDGDGFAKGLVKRAQMLKGAINKKFWAQVSTPEERSGLNAIFVILKNGAAATCDVAETWRTTIKYNIGGKQGTFLDAGYSVSNNTGITMYVFNPQDPDNGPPIYNGLPLSASVVAGTRAETGEHVGTIKKTRTIQESLGKTITDSMMLYYAIANSMFLGTGDLTLGAISLATCYFITHDLITSTTQVAPKFMLELTRVDKDMFVYDDQSNVIHPTTFTEPAVHTYCAGISPTSTANDGTDLEGTPLKPGEQDSQRKPEPAAGGGPLVPSKQPEGPRPVKKKLAMTPSPVKRKDPVSSNNE